MVSHGKLILRLNKFEVERYHGQIGDPDDTPDGTGVLLWFEIDDFYAAMERVSEMKAEIIPTSTVLPSRPRQLVDNRGLNSEIRL